MLLLPFNTMLLIIKLLLPVLSQIYIYNQLQNQQLLKLLSYLCFLYIFLLNLSFIVGFLCFFFFVVVFKVVNVLHSRTHSLFSRVWVNHLVLLWFLVDFSLSLRLAFMCIFVCVFASVYWSECLRDKQLLVVRVVVAHFLFYCLYIESGFLVSEKK